MADDGGTLGLTGLLLLACVVGVDVSAAYLCN